MTYNLVPVIHQSRWGYHSCSKEEFLLIKEFHWLAYLDMICTKKYMSWHQKKPCNRSGQAPNPCLGFPKKRYQDVLKQYRIAKTPFEKPELAPALELVDWKNLLAHLRVLYGAGNIGVMRGPRVTVAEKDAITAQPFLS